MSRSLVTVLCAGVCALALTAPATVRADDPVSSNVRFNREIIRILQRRCLPCHTPGGLDVSLATYRDVRDWSRAIREEVIEQRMPPAPAAQGYGRFQNTLSLTPRETTTLLAWLDGGMPRGDDKDLPPPLDADNNSDAHGDARIVLPPQNVPALEELVVRRVTVDPQLTSDRLVSRVEVRPGSRAVMRGALVYQGEDERTWVGAWLPWQHSYPAPAARAFRLAKGVPMTVVLYYRGTETATVDRSSLELHFAEAGEEPVESVVVEAASTPIGETKIAAPMTVWALQPVIGNTTQSLELRARRPDGSIDVLLWVPTARAEWPSVLVLEEPVTLPANTVLKLAIRANGSEPRRDRVIVSAWPAMPHQP